MTTANAPYPNYNGIPYNRAFFSSSTTTSQSYGNIVSSTAVIPAVGTWTHLSANPAFTVLTLSAGTWILNYDLRLSCNVQFTPSSVDTFIYKVLEPTVRYACQAINMPPTGGFTFSGSCILKLTATTTDFNVAVVVNSVALNYTGIGAPKGNTYQFTIGTSYEVANFTAIRIA